jgi:hypothetical protein
MATPAPQTEPIPSAATLSHAARIAIKDDYPIQLDYYAPSCSDKVFIGEDAGTKESYLVKSADEYTSNIMNVFKVGGDFIVLTANSLYIVSAATKKKRLPANFLQ